MRGTTARTCVGFLAAVLLSLPFFAPAASFASAHTLRQAEAKGEPGKGLTGEAVREEFVSHGTCDSSGSPTGPRPTRDRNRPADPVLQAPGRPPLEGDPAAAHEPVTPAAAHPHAARPQANTPAVLQVFRC
ncbi:hypothetical protein FNH04_21075 [Streptomyces phyllanthi]|uniref:Uncharacterized protein n=1 Tax=Streptomyces phyllanthi TaxID=1803180 RepID=A0A5N8W491_9ACTN|nr:hypothetical protein [Streptomyces phyllanthi]